MVRLVFRPYTQVRRSICTSESLRTSTRVSSGFVLLKHSSPSFGSQRVCSCSASSSVETETGRRCADKDCSPDLALADTRPTFTFIAPSGFDRPATCTHVEILGPCFKTGRLDCRTTRHRPKMPLGSALGCRTPAAVRQHCKTVQPGRTTRGDRGSVLRKAGKAIPRSAATADAVVGYNSPAEAGGTFQRSFDRRRIGRDAAWKEVRRSVTVYPLEPVRETASDGPLLRRRRPHG